ncbi:hypothetical protein CU098_005571 [Rhizopus stolonifer]|uniref:Uncharacterized protein n=1 Tax=Rhizopus stolonifer TaxID=4846 RepID=A0A367IWS7_RHIST|nr:hypothetical protein CU098_005571 [Rhizopus stolonifer]
MTAKSAGSGILTTGRASEKTLAKPKLTEDRAKTNPASSHKPNERTQPIVMSESVQKQLQDALDSHSEMQKSSPKEDHAIEHHDNMDISVDRPIQRIQRLRPAASFATMRQLANTNHQKIQHMKKRPVSFMDASSQYDENDVSVHLPSQRAGAEDQQVPFLSASPSPPSSVASGNSYRILSPYVHNLIIKDGDGHRIIQCVGIDDHPSSIEHDRPPPAEMTDEYAFMYSRPPLEEPKLCWIYQQQDALDSHHIRSSSQCRRKDSVKSFSSLSSYDTKLEQLKNKLEKEKATIKALQKQKEAYNKDVIFLSQNVDELTVDNMEWKRQFETEKIQKERLQEELSKTMTQLDKATEHIRRLESQNQTLIFELKNKELEEKASSPALEGAEKALATQLQHTQNQVRLLKTAMEQFLRMGIFSDALTVSSPTNSTEAFVSDIQKPRRPSSTKKNPSKQTNEKRQKGSKTPQNKLPLSPQPSENKSISTEELDIQLRELVREKEIVSLFIPKGKN